MSGIQRYMVDICYDLKEGQPEPPFENHKGHLDCMVMYDDHIAEVKVLKKMLSETLESAGFARDEMQARIDELEAELEYINRDDVVVIRTQDENQIKAEGIEEMLRDTSVGYNRWLSRKLAKQYVAKLRGQKDG